MSNPAGPAIPPANFPKQAIVVIHGMGEQVPMGTIRDFVRAVWETDETIGNPKMAKSNPTEVWSKPDLKTGSLELRRITTRQSKGSSSFPDGVRNDFYELYWADLNAGSTLSQVENWVFGLLLRWKTIPPRLRGAWFILVLASLFLFYLGLMSVVKTDFTIPGTAVKPYGWADALYLGAIAGPVTAAALAWILNKFVVQTFGRVVRYTRAQPDNIAARKAIRERGLDLLNALHDGTYERIIIVGHSLGSILGYDLISYFWASRSQAYTFQTNGADFKHLQAIEKASDDLTQASNAYLAAAAGPDKDARKTDLDRARTAFHAARRALAHCLRTRPKPKAVDGKVDPLADPRWLITDFVTLGSPLTHCEFLLNADRTEFEIHKALRELPIAPPVQELLDPDNKPRAEAADLLLKGSSTPLDKAMAFPFDHDDENQVSHEYWQLHHAAPFAVVNWTNIFDPEHFGYMKGDVISGPLEPLYGPAVTDINLADIPGRQHAWFTHTKYWTLDDPANPPPPVIQLRRILNLSGETV